jgi:ribosomal protein S18 acetylase RimI-like enzyme
MPTVDYIAMTDAQHHPALLSMMRQLYKEDPATVPPDDSHFAATLQMFLTKPDTGRIILFLDETNTLHGYSILIPYWSNEFGGVILFVDELNVRPESRRGGIGRAFFAWLSATKPFAPRVIALEVSPSNPQARRLYESIGFQARRYTMMTLPIM